MEQRRSRPTIIIMNILVLIFNTVLYRPLLNGLILLYEYIPGHDFGIAIIILTLIIRSLLYPSSIRGVRSQKALADLQPKIKEIQEKYKNNKEEQTKLLMELYKKEKSIRSLVVFLFSFNSLFLLPCIKFF